MGSCPDDDGKFHKCCHEEAKCVYKNQCPGLAGDCCPTPGGQMLGCCLKESQLELDEPEETELVYYRRRRSWTSSEVSEEGVQGASVLDEPEETELYYAYYRRRRSWTLSEVSEEGVQGASVPVVAIGGFAVGAAVTLGVLMKFRSGSNERPGYVTLG